jgi:hypothetical protein
MINFKFNLPLLLIVFFALFFVFGSYNRPSKLTFKDLQLEVLDSLKVDQKTTCIIGSSRMRELGNPSFFYKKQPNIVNLSMNGSSFMINFFIALYILENKNPKNILFEITPYEGVYLKTSSNIQLFDAFSATSLNYAAYRKILYKFKKATINTANTGCFIYSNNFYDYTRTFNFLSFVKNTKKSIMLEDLSTKMGNNLFNKDSFNSNVNSEIFKYIKKFDFNIDEISELPIEAYFIAYLNEIAAKKLIDIKYVVPVTLNVSLKEYEYYPSELYNLGIKGMHKYDSLFLKSVYRKENFADDNHYNRQGMELFYNEVFN